MSDASGEAIGDSDDDGDAVVMFEAPPLALPLKVSGARGEA